ncbi:MAG: DUF2892 domain-containing protein [Proteobacteria bacterium]|jgi:hypothetical protein|nr:DUF2892 domain-containing protein [Pseudomonadota bacterium]
MIINESRDDRIMRVVLGVVLIGLGGVGLLSIPGVIALVTGIVGFCPLYKVLGISTCPAS